MEIKYLLLLIPALTIPFIIRYIYIHLIYFIARKHEYPLIHSLLYEGWEDPHISEVMESVHILAKSKVKSHFTPSYQIFEDAKEILYIVQHELSGKNKKDGTPVLHFSFTPERLIQCILLFLSDVYREYQSKWWFKRILNIKIEWFVRGKNFKDRFSAFMQNPILRMVSKSRSAGLFLRLIFIPLFGPPFIVFWIIRSYIITFLWEGWIRYFYSMLLIRFSYYAVFLYSQHNTVIERRLKQFSNSNITKQKKKYSNLLNPVLWETKSNQYINAVTAYLHFLDKIKQPPDSSVLGINTEPASVDKFWKQTQNILKRIFNSSRKAFEKQIDSYSRPDYLNNIKDMMYIIGSQYYPYQKSFDKLCIHEIFLSSYTGALYFLSNLYTAPITSPLLRSVNIDFLFKIKEIAETDIVQYALKGARYSGKIGSLLFRTRKGLSIIRGGSGATGLLISLGTPFVYQHIEDSIITFFIHRMGRLYLLLFEESMKSKKNKTALSEIINI